MNENRTFGIEIECFAKYDRYTVAERIQNALREAGFSQDTVTVESYSHMTSNYNFNHWKVESDASLVPSMSIRETYPHAMEIKSPVLKGAEGLKRLKTVCDAIDGIATVNVRCGLHVHHGMQDLQEGESLHHLINAWIRHEDIFMKALPNSRQSNNYARKWSATGYPSGRKNYIRPEESVRNWYNSNISDRRVTLNFESYWMRNTVEVRMHSGTVEFEKMKNWLTVTQLYIEKALKGVYKDSPDVVEFDEFVTALKDESEVRGGSTRRRVRRRPSNGEYIHPDAKRSKMPRRGTKAHTIVKMLLRDGGASKTRIVMELDTEHGVMPEGKQEKLVAGQLTNMKTLKWGYGFNIVKGADNNFRLLPMADVFEEDEEVTDDGLVTVIPVTEDQKVAVDWFVERCNHFESQRSGSEPAPAPRRRRRSRSDLVDALSRTRMERGQRHYTEEARHWLDELND